MSDFSTWSLKDIGDRSGQTVLITGANSGIGFFTAKALLEAGAHVVFGCRDPRRAQAAAEKMSVDIKDASFEILSLDLQSQDSVKQAAQRFLLNHERLDLLINNAGVMAAPKRVTADGYESQFATNHFGHFTLTARLLSTLLRTKGSRIVTISSLMHRYGRLALTSADALQHLSGYYGRWRTYADTKLANIMFAFELDRRFKRAGVETLSIGAHPGYAHTELVVNGPAKGGGALRQGFYRLGGQFGQSAHAGALPTLFAACGDVPGGSFVGPSGLLEMAGQPTIVTPSARARDEEAAKRLVSLSETITGESLVIE